jgi:hypothetical protein
VRPVLHPFGCDGHRRNRCAPTLLARPRIATEKPVLPEKMLLDRSDISLVGCRAWRYYVRFPCKLKLKIHSEVSDALPTQNFET